MALAFNRVLTQVLTDQEPAAAATVVSAEQDLGDDTLAEQIWLHMTIADFAGVPVGNMQIGIQPLHTTGGTVFNDNTAWFVGTVAADATQYDFAFPVASLPRYFLVAVKNNTNQAVTDNALQAWISYVAVTA